MKLTDLVIGSALALGITTTAQADINPCKKTKQGLQCQQKLGDDLFIYYDVRENWKNPTQCVAYRSLLIEKGHRVTQQLIDKDCDNEVDIYVVTEVRNRSAIKQRIVDLENAEFCELVPIYEAIGRPGNLYQEIKEQAIQKIITGDKI